MIAGHQCGRDLSDTRFSVSFLLYRLNCLVIILNDVSVKHDVSILRVNQAEIIWFVLLRECSFTTLRPFGKSASIPIIFRCSFMTYWRHWLDVLIKKMKQTLKTILSGLSAVGLRINHNNNPLDTATLQRRPQVCTYSVCLADLI